MNILTDLGIVLAALVALYGLSHLMLWLQERRDGRRQVMSAAARQHKLEQDIGFFGGRQ
jgi:hypothetical protein